MASAYKIQPDIPAIICILWGSCKLAKSPLNFAVHSKLDKEIDTDL